jgi:phage-related protein
MMDKKGLNKKTDKTPSKELAIARRRMQEVKDAHS